MFERKKELIYLEGLDSIKYQTMEIIVEGKTQVLKED
jgi:hypothetical protein